jgi:hypothetical protein
MLLRANIHIPFILVRFSDEGFMGGLKVMSVLRKELLGSNQTAKIAENDRKC